MDSFHNKAAELRAESSAADAVSIHANYAHSWDEVNSRFRAQRASRYKRPRNESHQQVINQRGQFLGSVLRLSSKERTICKEGWLCKSKLVDNLSAAGLMPAISQAMPEQFSILSDERKALNANRQVDSSTLNMCFDKAASNILLVKRIARHWRRRLFNQSGKRMFMFAESCGPHLHHRGKLQVKRLKHHTTRHFALHNICRLASVQDQCIAWIERVIPNRVVRKVGAAPPVRRSLRQFIDILYKPQSAFHQRKKQVKSGFLDDLEFLASMVNGELGKRSTPWTHWCWDYRSSRPCCKNQSETARKTVIAVVNVTVRTQGRPCESRWTNTLPNFKLTLTKEVLYQVGNDSIPIELDEREYLKQNRNQNADGEAEGGEQFEIQAKLKRHKQTKEYLADKSSIPEVSVLTVILEEVDTHLLYPFIGDATSNKERRSKASTPALKYFPCQVNFLF